MLHVSKKQREDQLSEASLKQRTVSVFLKHNKCIASVRIKREKRRSRTYRAYGTNKQVVKRAKS